MPGPSALAFNSTEVGRGGGDWSRDMKGQKAHLYVLPGLVG